MLIELWLVSITICLILFLIIQYYQCKCKSSKFIRLFGWGLVFVSCSSLVYLTSYPIKKTGGSSLLSFMLPSLHGGVVPVPQLARNLQTEVSRLQQIQMGISEEIRTLKTNIEKFKSSRILSVISPPIYPPPITPVVSSTIPSVTPPVTSSLPRILPVASKIEIKKEPEGRVVDTDRDNSDTEDDFSIEPIHVSTYDSIESGIQRINKPLDLTNPGIQDMIEQVYIPVKNTNPLYSNTWKKIDNTIYHHLSSSGKALMVIRDTHFPYIQLSQSFKDLFPKVYSVYHDVSTQQYYIEIEKIPNTLEIILTQQIPKEILRTMNVSESIKEELYTIFQKKLPISNVLDVSDFPSNVSKEVYESFIDQVKGKWLTYLERIEPKIKNMYDTIHASKFTYTSYLCKDIGIREDENIVWTRPIKHIQYDPMSFDISTISIYKYSIDGTYSINHIQIPCIVESSQRYTIPSPFREIIDIHTTLKKN